MSTPMPAIDAAILRSAVRLGLLVLRDPRPEFIVVRPGARLSYRSLSRAILEARAYRVPVLHDGAPVTWRAAREGQRVKLTAWLAVGGAR
jgi:hypothetical protein